MSPRLPRFGWSGTVHTLCLLAGGFAGATALSLLRMPAGALIGAVVGSMVVNRLADRHAQRRSLRKHREVDPGAADRIRGLPGYLRVTGLVLLGVMAGSRLSFETLRLLAESAVPVALSVVVLLLLALALARYLFRVHRVDPLTAVMAVAPGGISELVMLAQQHGAAMHVVLSVHLLRVLAVVLVVLPLVILVIGR